MAAPLRRLWKNEYLQTVVTIIVVVMVVFAFWSGLRLALNDEYPILAVASGSMSTVQPDSAWSYPFVPTLHAGDLIIVQGVAPQDIYAAPFNEVGRSGDILVFRNPENPEELIVHRAIGWYDNDTVVTKGDGNISVGPPRGGLVPVNYVVGKVVFCIPWIGNVALFMQNRSSVLLVLVLIVIILVAELVLSAPEDKGTETKNQER